MVPESQNEPNNETRIYLIYSWCTINIQSGPRKMGGNLPLFIDCLLWVCYHISHALSPPPTLHPHPHPHHQPYPPTYPCPYPPLPPPTSPSHLLPRHLSRLPGRWVPWMSGTSRGWDRGTSRTSSCSTSWELWVPSHCNPVPMPRTVLGTRQPTTTATI